MKKSRFPHLSKDREKEVHDIFKKWGIESHQNTIVGPKNIRWPGVNAPIEKFSRFKSDGYTFRVTNKTSLN